jgi:hypothetical protein
MAATLKNAYYDILKKNLCHKQEHVSSNGRTFVLCKSCFWCASILYDDVRPFRTCLICMNCDLEFMPISTDETYKFDYDRRRGVTLEFINTLSE